MSTTVSFAGNLTADPELSYTREGGKPYVSFRVMVNHRSQNAQGEWQEEELEALWAAWKSSYTNERVPRNAVDAVQWHDALQRVLARIKEQWMGAERGRSVRSATPPAPSTQPIPMRREAP